MKTDPPRRTPPRAPPNPGFSGPGGINGSGRPQFRQESEGGASSLATESPAVMFPVTSRSALPRCALAALALAIAMFAFSSMHIWKHAEFAAAALLGLTMILLLLAVVADGNKSPL